MGGKSEPETPEYERIQQENAAKNLAFANELHDRNFSKFKKAALRDTRTRMAGAGSADAAAKASKVLHSGNKPMAVVAGQTASALGQGYATQVVDDASGIKLGANAAMGQLDSARKAGSKLSSLGHNQAGYEMDQAFAKANGLVDLASAGAGAAYYKTDGWGKGINAGLNKEKGLYKSPWGQSYLTTPKAPWEQ